MSRSSQHLDAVDLEGRGAPLRRHQLEESTRIARGLLVAVARPMVDRARPEAVEVRKIARAATPRCRSRFDEALREPEIERALDASAARGARIEQRTALAFGQQWCGGGTRHASGRASSRIPVR